MVMLEKLSLSNMGTFKQLYIENFKKISYNKDFFRCYDEQNFLIKYMYRKLIRLIKVNDTYIGYIWYDGSYDKYIKVWALYIDFSYIDYIDKSTLSFFNKNILSYEEIDSKENNLVLRNLGFNKEHYTILLKMNINNFNISSLSLDYKFIDKYLYNLNNNEDQVSIRALSVGKDEILRCSIQNNIFSQLDRKPLTIDDIYADMVQDYFLKDLCFFGLFNNEYIGYGQIIFNRNMYTIVNFGIDDKYRGKGLSKIFLKKIIDEAKKYGIDELYIRVDSNNIKAINLYKSIGFKEINKILVWERKC